MGAKTKNSGYSDAYKQYQQAISNYQNTAKEYAAKYDQTAQQEAAKYQEAVNKYSGDTGYKNALALAKGEAQDLSSRTAANTRNQAATTARHAGMTKAQAAALGSSQVANAYQNAYNQNLTQQQAQAQQNYNNALSAAQTAQAQNMQNAATSANLVVGAQQNAANLYGSGMNSQQSEYANEFNRGQTWLSNATLGLGTLSDARLKTYTKIGVKVAKHKKPDFNALKIKEDK